MPSTCKLISANSPLVGLYDLIILVLVIWKRLAECEDVLVPCLPVEFPFLSFLGLGLARSIMSIVVWVLHITLVPFFYRSPCRVFPFTHGRIQACGFPFCAVKLHRVETDLAEKNLLVIIPDLGSATLMLVVLPYTTLRIEGSLVAGAAMLSLIFLQIIMFSEGARLSSPCLHICSARNLTCTGALFWENLDFAYCLICLAEIGRGHIAQ